MSFFSITHPFIEQAMSVDCDWSVYWTDPRLSGVAQDSPTPRDIPRHLSHQVWSPDIYIKNARDVQLVNLPVEQQRLTIDRDGVLQHSMR